MKARYAIRKTGAQMKERHRRPVEHTPVPVSRPGADALKKTEHGPYPGLSVERCNYGYLRRPCVGETDIDTISNCSFKDHIRTSHCSSRQVFSEYTNSCP